MIFSDEEGECIFKVSIATFLKLVWFLKKLIYSIKYVSYSVKLISTTLWTTTLLPVIKHSAKISGTKKSTGNDGFDGDSTWNHQIHQ